MEGGGVLNVVSVIVRVSTFSLSQCESRDVTVSFSEKIRNFPGVHCKCCQSPITLTEKTVIILSKNICFSLFIFNESEIQFETLE